MNLFEDSKTKRYLCDYCHNGQHWSIEIPAESWEDARARLSKIGRGEIIGEVQLSVRLPAVIGWFAKLWRYIRQAF